MSEAGAILPVLRAQDDEKGAPPHPTVRGHGQLAGHFSAVGD